VEVPKSLQFKVKPNARENRLELSGDGIWLAQIKAQPVDGKANEALVALIAKHFKCRKHQVILKSGAGSRLKRFVLLP
jgi:uncharacterized protein YggU (UPF0235/DUF167 family)